MKFVLTGTCVKQPDSMESTRRFFDVQNAFTGTSDQTGPPVNVSKTLLGMSHSVKHGQS